MSDTAVDAAELCVAVGAAVSGDGADNGGGVVWWAERGADNGGGVAESGGDADNGGGEAECGKDNGGGGADCDQDNGVDVSETVLGVRNGVAATAGGWTMGCDSGDSIGRGTSSISFFIIITDN